MTTELQINMAAQQYAEDMLLKLKDPEHNTFTTIEAMIQQLRLLIEPPRRDAQQLDARLGD